MRKKKSKALPETVFASDAQIRAVKNDIRELETMLENDKRLFTKSPRIQDETAFKAEILKKQQWLERHTPRALRGEAANKAYKEYKQLAEKLKENMPKASMFYQRYPRGDDPHTKHQKFEEAVKAEMALQKNPELKRAMFRFNHLAAKLDPSNPELRSVERLRSKR